jgi:hypothetical protein
MLVGGAERQQLLAPDAPDAVAAAPAPPLRRVRVHDGIDKGLVRG